MTLLEPSFLATPKSVSISITGKCNLHCAYCFYADEMVGLQDLETHQWLDFFKQLKKLSVMDVTLTGGEAFLRPDLFELIDGVIENRMRYCILSNGTLIDEAMIENFSHGKRKKRMNYIQISIDGSCAEIHNKSRPGSFSKAINGLKLLKKHNFPLAVRTTINKHNLEDLKNIARLLLEDIGLPSFSTNEAMPIGSGCRNEKDVALDAKEKLRAMGIINELLIKYPGRLTATAGPQANFSMYDEMLRSRNGEDIQTAWKKGHLSACGCIFSSIGILHDGTIVPCCMLPELRLGNIVDDDVENIWNNHLILNQLRSRRMISMKEVKGCERCEWNIWCNGGCPGMAFELTGNVNSANPEDCLKNFLKMNNLSHRDKLAKMNNLFPTK